MNYQQVQDYALLCSLEHHLCNVEELMDNGFILSDILALVEAGSNAPVIWEHYAYAPREDVVEMIEDARGVHLYNFMRLLTEVNGKEWATSFKEGN
jgi:hypothetical protein